jgi:hypothetical protein
VKGTPALLTLLRLRSASLLYAQPAGAAMPAYAGRGCAYRSVSSSLRRRRRSHGESRGATVCQRTAAAPLPRTWSHCLDAWER